jgi:membrane protein YdbS with pleckstrin-like domain
MPTKNKKVSLATWLLGFNIGLILPLLIGIIYIAATQNSQSFPRGKSVIIIYRMVAMAIFLVWGWGFDMWIWEKFRINYVFIFEMNSRKHVQWQHVLEVSMATS